MTHFWDYESKQSRNKRLATQWEQGARKWGFEFVARNRLEAQGLPEEALPPYSTGNPFDKVRLGRAALDEIEKPVKKSRQGVLSKTFGAIDDATSTVFGGKVRQPWDLLRPVQRALEAEQKYIARPLAKAALSPLPGDYEDLPGIIRAGAEVLTDPLTYIGPGVVLKAARVAKLAPAMKLAVPGLDVLSPGAGSKRALAYFLREGGYGLAAVAGGEAAKAVGLPPLVGSTVGVAAFGRTPSTRKMDKIINPSDITVYHGTGKQFEGLPSIEFAGKHFEISTQGVYTSLTKSIAKGEGGPRLIEIKLKKGAKLFDPAQDEWPKGYEDLKSAYDQGKIKTGYATIYDDEGKLVPNTRGDEAEPVFDNMVRWFQENRGGPGKTQRDALVEEIKKDYQGIATPFEIIIFDKNIMEDASKKVVDALSQGPGTPHESQNLDTAIGKLAYKVATAPTDFFGVKTREEVIADGLFHKSGTQAVRGAIADALSTSDNGVKIRELLRRNGLKLQDTWVAPLINFHQRKSALGSNYGAVVSDTQRTVLKRATTAGTLGTKEINHMGARATVVTDPNLLTQAGRIAADKPDLGLMADGQLHLGDLVENFKLFELTKDQQSVLDSLHAPVQAHRDLEKLFDVGRETDTTNGYYAHRQLIKTTVPTGAGELVESTTGPIVAQRLGAKQSFSRPRTVKTLSQGFMAGNKYLPFEESQSARVAQGYRVMADEWLNRALEGVGKTAVELVPKEIEEGLKSLGRARGQLHWLKREIGRAANTGARNAWITPKWKDSAVTPEIGNLVNDAIIVANLPKKSLRITEWKKLQESLDRLSKDTNNKYFPLKEKRATTMRQIRESKTPGARGATPIEFHGKYYEQSIGTELSKLDDIDSPTGIERTVQNINNSIRPVMATLDLSFMGVQGIIAALSHPTNYLTALKTIFSGGYGDYVESLKRSGQLDSMIRDGVHWAAKNDFSEFIFPSAMSRIPGFGPAADVSNALFSSFGNVLRSEMYKAGVGLDLSDLARKNLARNVNLVSGFSPNNPGSIERSLMFAPRFFRSQLGLIADSLTKKPGLTTGSAARSLGVFITSGIALTYIANEALGNETDLDPTSSNFLRVRLGDKDMSIFGTWDTLLRALTISADQGPDEGARYLSRVKASPVVSRLWDLIEGETLSGMQLSAGSPGDILESAAKLASTNLPISTQQFITEPPDISSPESILGSGIQFLGTKSTPLSPSEKLEIKRNEESERAYGKQWDLLEPYQQDQLKKDKGLESRSETDIGRAFAFRTAIGERFQQRQEEVDSSLPVGREWIDAYQDLRREQVGAYAQWAEEHTEAIAKIRHAKTSNPNEQARQDFYGLFDTADKENWTPEELSTALDEFQSALSTEQKSYLERNTGLRDSPRVKQYKAAQKVLRPYWQLEDVVYDRLKTRLPQGTQAENLQDYTNQLIMRLQEAGLPDAVILKRIQTNPVLREIDRATTTLRERYRERHPDADRLLVQWYGYSPIRGR